MFKKLREARKNRRQQSVVQNEAAAAVINEAPAVTAEKPDIIERIKKALDAAGISIWRINSVKTESCELFFIKKKLDLRRLTDLTKYSVTVFTDFDGPNGKCRGSSGVKIHPCMNDDDILQVLEAAKDSAQYVSNPFFEFSAPEKEAGSECDYDCEKGALTMVDALFKADNHEHGFINSAEFFSIKTTERIVCSNGTDVEFSFPTVKGEFVVQCLEPQDVEIYRDFSYTKPYPDELTKKVNDAIIAVENRAKATESAPSGVYDVVLTGDHVRTMLDFYIERSDAAFIYAGYSDFKVGNSVQGDSPSGEKLNIRLLHDVPFSDEGIRYSERDLTKDGVLNCIPGSQRFAFYLETEPTGSYSKLGLNNGTVPFDEMKKGCLVPVTFSDFQMDADTGHFGGEIRLAYLYDADGNVSLITGGSINGDIFSVQGDLLFSSEKYESSDYVGPYAMRIKGVSVAG